MYIFPPIPIPPDTFNVPVLVDIDSLSDTENKTSFLHWGVINISSSDVSSGEEVSS